MREANADMSRRIRTRHTRTGCVLYPEMAIMLSASNMRSLRLAVAASRQPKKLTT
jgi:hypothetical protein